MGTFSFLQKEYYINKLTKSFSFVFGYNDFTSIKYLRKNYTTQELKIIYRNTRDLVSGLYRSDPLSLALIAANFTNSKNEGLVAKFEK